jgi:hypothetical protein
MKETQEAAELYAEPYRCPKTADTREYCKHDIISAFNNGAKWQSERMYSEDDMIEYADYSWKFSNDNRHKNPLSPKEWFEQFKKK